MSKYLEELQRLLAEMAVLIDQNNEPDPQLYAPFFHHPEYAFQLIELLNNFDDNFIDDSSAVYSACIFAFDICLGQLQAAAETDNKVVAKSLNQLMERLAELIKKGKHSLAYWLPLLNAFYEVHIELNQELKDAYLDLVQEESSGSDEDEFSHLESIRTLIHELSDLSVFDIAENFFAQSHVMPPDFFTDLVIDLYSIPEGQEIGLLTLLHPKAEVRAVVVATIDQIIGEILLSSTALSRLQTIKYWYPAHYAPTFDRWLKIQRKKGVVFDVEEKLDAKKVTIKSTEVDGSGSQGIFIHVHKRRGNKLGGLLFKEHLGIKDAWLTPVIPAAEVKDYYQQAFADNSVTLREVDLDYFKLMAEHFLALTIERGETPNLHFMELQELLALRFRPQRLDVSYWFEQLSVQITPFTQDAIDTSLKRSKMWLKNKQFTESWYQESAVIDKIVNHNSSFVDGVKVCRIEDAMEDLFVEDMELHREQWQFHFLWTALWLRARAKKNEKVWQDSFLIAYVIRGGLPLKEVPVLKEICYQTVLNSIETMQDRRTYLNKE